MKATLLQENLQKAINLTNRFINNKTQLSILENILIEIKKTNIVFSATNLESSIVIQVPAKVEKEGRICLPAKTLQELVSSLSSNKVFLEKKQEKLSIKCGQAFIQIKGLDASDFPNIPKVEKQNKIWQIEGKILEEVCVQVAFAAASDESRPALTGIRVNIEKGKLEMVATDGYRLSKKNLILESIKTKELFIVPARPFLEAAKILAKETEEISFCLEKKQNQLIIFTEDVYIVCRLIDGEFPPFAKIVPSVYQTTVSVDKEELVRALKIASVFSRESANIVKFKVQSSENRLKISANSPLVGENESEISADIKGEDIEIAFNFRFLLEFLNVTHAEQIKIKFSGNLSPAVFEAIKDESFFHLIMPVRLQS